jgi:hypothetical protein
MDLTPRSDEFWTDLLTSDPELFAQPDKVEKWRVRLRSESHSALREIQQTLKERAAAHRSDLERLLRKSVGPLAEQVADDTGLDSEQVREEMEEAVVRWPVKFGNVDNPGKDFPHYSDITSEQRETVKQILRKREQISEKAFEFERELFAIEVVLREDLFGQLEEIQSQSSKEESSTGGSKSGPTDREKEHARTVLDAVEGRDAKDFRSYAKVGRRVEEEGVVSEMISSEAVVKGAKRCASKLGFSPKDGSDLIEVLRKADGEGSIGRPDN